MLLIHEYGKQTPKRTSTRRRRPGTDSDGAINLTCASDQRIVAAVFFDDEVPVSILEIVLHRLCSDVFVQLNDGQEFANKMLDYFMQQYHSQLFDYEELFNEIAKDPEHVSDRSYICDLDTGT